MPARGPEVSPCAAMRAFYGRQGTRHRDLGAHPFADIQSFLSSADPASEGALVPGFEVAPERDWTSIFFLRASKVRGSLCRGLR